MAIKIDRNYFKAWLRIFQSCEKLGRFKEVCFTFLMKYLCSLKGLEMVNKAFELTSDRSKEMNEKFIQFREKFTKKSKEIEKLERKQVSVLIFLAFQKKFAEKRRCHQEGKRKETRGLYNRFWSDP